VDLVVQWFSGSVQKLLIKKHKLVPYLYIYKSYTMEQKKKSTEEIKELLGLDKILPEINGREKLLRMIDPNKYYLVSGHALPFMGAAILKKNFQPSLIKEDLGYKITAAQWKEFNRIKEEQESWLHQRQQIQEE
jgi:hypothetical protein